MKRSFATMKNKANRPAKAILRRRAALILAGSVAALLGASQSTHAANKTWNNTAGGDFNTGTNWTPTGVPVTADSGLFTTALTGNVTLSAAATPGSITFGLAANNSTTNNLTIGVNGGNTLTFGNGGNLSVLNTLAGTGKTFTIAAPVILTPASSSTAGSFTIQNDATSSTNTLVVSGGISSSTTNNTETLTLAGANTGNNTISGNITNGTATTFALTKSGAGTWILSGTGNSYNGATTISTGTLSLTGSLTGATAITNSGTFTESGAGVIGSAAATLTNSAGTTTLSGLNTYTGATSVNGGTLALDFSGATAPTTAINIIKTGNTINLGGGALTIKGNTSGTNAQTFGTTALTTLTASKVTLNSNGATLNTNFGGFTHNAQSSMDVTLPALGTTSATASALGGVLVDSSKVAYATANGGTTWLAQTGTALSALSSYASAYTTATNNVDVANGDAPAAFTVNTLRFNAATDGLTLTGTNILNAGGILVTPTATAASISGAGTLTSGTTNTNAELVIHNYGSLNVGSVLANNGAKALNLTLTGSGGTTKLSGANTHTGLTSLLTGTLNLANQLALQNSTFQSNTGTSLVFDQSVVANAFTLGALQGSGNISLLNNAGTPAAVTLTVGGNNAGTTYSGVLSGTGGSLTKTGSGTFVLSNANTYTGATVVNGGILQLNNNNAIKTSSSVTVTGTGLLGLTGGSASTYLATGVVIAGTGGVTNLLSNPNTAITLDRDNTYTGQTTWGQRGVFNAGVISKYDGSGNQISGAFGVNSRINFAAQPDTLSLNGNNNQVGSLSGTPGGGGGVLLRGATITIGGDNTNATYNGPITNNYLPGTDQNGNGSTGQVAGGNVIKIGTGTQTINSTNNPSGYEGTTTIKGGVLSINVLGTNGDTANNPNGTSGYVTATTTIVNTTTLTVASGTTGLVKGMSVFDLQSLGNGAKITNLVDNGTTITITLSGGLNGAVTGTKSNVNYGFGSSIGISGPAAANLVLDGGTLRYTGVATTTDRLFTVGSTVAGATGTLDGSGSGAITFGNTGSIAYGTADQTRTLGLTGSTAGNIFNPLIGDNGLGAVSVLKSGTGSWTLTNTGNTYSGGTTVNAGTLTSAVAGGFGAGDVTVNPTGIAGTSADAATLNTTGSIASTALVTVNTNSATAIGTVNFNGATPTIGGLSGNGNAVLNNASGTALTVGSTNNLTSTFGGVISEGTPGMGSLVKAGTGTLTLLGANTYTGATTIGTAAGGGVGAGDVTSMTANGGTLVAGGAGALGSGGTYSAPQIVSTAGTGTSSIAVNNGGTLLLSGAGNIDRVSNTAGIVLGTTGATGGSVGGTLAIGPTGTGPNAVLEGTGASTVGGVVTGSPTTSTVGLGALTLSSNSTLDFGAAGVGTMVFSTFAPAGFTLNVVNYTNTTTNGTDTSGVDGTDDRLIFNYDVSGAGQLSQITFNGGAAAQISLDAGFYEITISAIPEPSTWFAGAALLGLAGFRERRRLLTRIRKA